MFNGIFLIISQLHFDVNLSKTFHTGNRSKIRIPGLPRDFFSDPNIGREREREREREW